MTFAAMLVFGISLALIVLLFVLKRMKSAEGLASANDSARQRMSARSA
jgi:hypothetical protein